jgi:hypothetical protein
MAWGGDEGDDFAALEKTQDTLAGSVHERADTVETDGVNMRIEPQVAVGALDDGHGAGFPGRQTALDVPATRPSRH